MEIENGYRWSECGVIPQDWDVQPYSKLFTFLPTSSFSRSELSNDGQVFYVHYGDIHTKWEHFIDFESTALPTIAKDKAKKYPQLKEGDLIMADASEDYEGIGKSVELRNMHERKAISGLHTFLLRDSKGTFVNGYKGYIHSCQYVKKSLDRLATGLKVYGVSKNNLKQILIPFPPTLEEQRAIAAALSDTDTLIAALDKLIDKKRHIKQAVMQQLLTGKKRLPGFSGVWITKELGKIADITKLAGFEYSNYFNSYKDGGEIIVIRGTNITKNILNLSDVKTIPRKTSNFLQRSKLCKNDLVFAYVGTIGPVYLIEEDDKYHLGPNTSKISCKKDISPQYLLIYFKSWLIKKEIAEHTSIGAQPSLSMTKIRKFKINFPKSKPEQDSIAEILSNMDTEIQALQTKREKIKAIKQGMMQELLTGKTRLI
jgi:type I restriction enzyme, S subunit